MKDPKKKTKVPFNWVGNKYKYIDEVNKLIEGKRYDKVIDLFMGSGNILFNIDVAANEYIGNDITKLLPMIYQELKNNNHAYSLDDVEMVLNKFNRFSAKEDYYIFREYWNRKYMNDEIDRIFIIETILLLKMCSNSMVRFNSKEGYFNQGFRGLGTKKEFFTEGMKKSCVDSLNELSEKLNNKYDFTISDFIDFKNGETKDLIILDPPYILGTKMYESNWNKEHEKKLNDLIETTKCEFIYFNYLERDGEINNELAELIDRNDFKVIEINDKTISGQASNNKFKSVREVLITNIKCDELMKGEV